MAAAIAVLKGRVLKGIFSDYFDAVDMGFWNPKLVISQLDSMHLILYVCLQKEPARIATILNLFSRVNFQFFERRFAPGVQQFFSSTC